MSGEVTLTYVKDHHARLVPGRIQHTQPADSIHLAHWHRHHQPVLPILPHGPRLHLLASSSALAGSRLCPRPILSTSSTSISGLSVLTRFKATMILRRRALNRRVLVCHIPSWRTSFPNDRHTTSVNAASRSHGRACKDRVVYSAVHVDTLWGLHLRESAPPKKIERGGNSKGE